MGTRGSYGIAHNDNLLVTYGDIDMYPSEWGFHLAKEAFDNRHRAPGNRGSFARSPLLPMDRREHI